MTAGGYLSLLVLIIEVIKLINFIMAISMKIMNDGIEGAKALVYMLCCGPHQLREKVKYRRVKLRAKCKCQASVAEEYSLQAQSDDLALTVPDL